MQGKPQASASPHLKFLLLSAILAATPGLAAAQFKCVDKNGHITLTDIACPGRNIRGKNHPENANQAGAQENAQLARGGNGSRNSSAIVPGGTMPARPLQDAGSERPPRAKPDRDV